jgi:SAM-dependent methyltransferase
MESHHRVTRGNGLLESWLAHLRAREANHLIPTHLREGRILDIGCGSYPYFLTHTFFSEKFAVDQLSPKIPQHDIEWYTLNLDNEPTLPFEAEFFSVVSMLAVVEHLNPSNLVLLFNEVSRTLIPGGVLVITTPAVW